jgi:excisionase family DNA binding protein
MSTDLEQLFNAKEVAGILSCSEDTVLNLIRSRGLRCIKFGRKFLFKKSWVDDFIEREADKAEKVYRPAV